MTSWHVHEGDVLERLREMPSNHFSALLSDPPYGLSFMGKAWDHGVPGVEVWREVLRVLKPGAPLLAFGGTRTFHRLAVAIEDAGFEIRDCVGFAWVYGSGFPKSLNIGAALDKSVGAEREVVGSRVLTGNAALTTKEKGGTYGVQVGTAPAKTVNVTAPSSDEAKRFDGYGTALKPAWEPVVLARKPMDGTVANNVTVHGVGGLAIDACRIDASGRPALESGTQTAPKQDGWGAMGQGSRVVGTTDVGRWPANVCLAHADGCRELGLRKVKAAPAWNDNRGPSSFTGAATSSVHHADDSGTETVAQWDCVEGCPVRELDAQSGTLTSGQLLTHHRRNGAAPIGTFNMRDRAGEPCDFGGDSGGASRFFYCAKPSRAERDFGCDALPLRAAGEMVDREDDSDGMNSPRAGAGRTSGARNIHPTLKPVSLTKWLAKLVLPPPRADGEPCRLLVPFCGSGSEMIGALLAGWDDVHGIEREAEYIAIAKARLSRWSEVPMHMDPRDVPSASSSAVDERQPSLFGKVGS